MKKKKEIDFDQPICKLTRMTDFLPPPEKLFPKNELKKITIALDKETLSFFKKIAYQYHKKYQRMIREVLKGYAKKYGT